MLKISNETKVGALTAIAITLLILGYNFLKGNDLFSTTRKYYARYAHVDGLTASNPVVLNGVKVGQVKKIHFREDQSLVVEFEIRSDLKISRKDTAQILNDNLLFGTKAIVLTTSHLGTVAENGDTLQAFITPSLAEQMTGVMNPLKKKINAIVQVLDSLTDKLTVQLNNSGASDLQKSMADVKSAITAFKTTIQGFDRLVNDDASKLNHILAHVESITLNLKKNNQEIERIIKNTRLISDSLAASNLKATVDQAQKSLEEVTRMMNKINKGEGSLGLLVNDKALYNNLQKSADDLDKLMIDLKKNPHRYLHFSVFGKKNKKENDTTHKK